MRGLAWAAASASLALACGRETPAPVAQTTPAQPPAPLAEAREASPAAPRVHGEAPAPAPTAKDRRFWAWVATHLDELRTITRGDEPIADELAAQLVAVEEGLTFELGVGTDPFELIISADGLRQHFPAVQRLVAAAPPIEGLKPIAFRPRKGTAVAMDGLELTADHVWFVATRSGDTLDVILYVPGLGGADEALRKHTTYLLLDTVLGEYDVETRLRGIEWRAAPTAPAAPLRPLTELPAEVDRLK
ncbi:MAG TPA: hypothetical protein VM734_28790 [Kofleriaceae bacterium]|nr:hypothetical protein [Kofleriaceae bacterium]